MARHTCEDLAQNGLGGAYLVDVCGVEEVDSRVERGANARPRRLLPDLTAVRDPVSERDLTHTRACTTQRSVFHRAMLPTSRRAERPQQGIFSVVPGFELVAKTTVTHR
jgi:hypothetical protein